MADKSFGVKDINLIGASGVPTIDSPNNLNINAVNVAISTDITVAGKVSLGAGTSISSPGSNTLTFGTNNTEKVRIRSDGHVGIGTDAVDSHLTLAAPSATARLELRRTNPAGGGTYGAINFTALDGHSVASIHAKGDVDGDDNGGDLVFRTTSAATSNDPYGISERLRITGIGSVGVREVDPDSNFHVTSSSNHVATFEYSSTSDMAIQLKNSQGSMYFGLGGGEEFAIATDADLNGNNMRFSVDQNGAVRTPDQPAALVYKNGVSQGITADAIINYDATSYSQGGMTINANRNRITVPVAGKYMINASTSGSVTTVSAGDGWKIRILRDGAVYNHTSGFPIETTGSETGQELAYVVSMVADAAAGDYFEIELENVGAARASMSYGYFGIYLLG